MSRRPQKLELTWYNKNQALIPTEGGRYGYTWVAPQDPRYCETHTLTIDGIIRGTQKPKVEDTNYSERADLTPTEDNLLVLGESGDFLEALTQVPELADKYVGKVKCVYIDPPFNTAQTFANYEDNLEHSIWLTMMRDRLIHLRNLLSDDGSIWVHLDDVENHRMRVLLDEVFGSNNFVAEVQWQKSDTLRNDAGGFSRDFDEIIVYSKTESGFSVNRLPRTEEMNKLYRSPDDDPERWFNPGPTAPGAKTHQGMVYAIQNPTTGELLYPLKGRHWAIGQAELLNLVSEFANYELQVIDDSDRRASLCGISSLEVRPDVPAIVLSQPLEEARASAAKRIAQGNWPKFYFTGKNGEGYLGKKTYIPKGGIAPQTFWKHDEVGSNRTSKAEIKNLFSGSEPFATPKPERLLERIIHIATDPGDVVLDIFAGSGTTAAVAQKMGRRWVTCELLEGTVERFTRPRLEKVVRGEDVGGISTTPGERSDATSDGLPEGISPEEAQRFTSLLNNVIADDDDLKKSQVVKVLKAKTKTKKSPAIVNWRGGGGFSVGRLSPSCFDYDAELDIVILTEQATGQTLVDSVAANLGFYLTPKDRHFDGVLGRQHLTVVEGILDEEKVDDLMAHLPQGHTLVLAATVVNEGVREYVRSFKNGSRVVNIPLDIFTYTQIQEEN